MTALTTKLFTLTASLFLAGGLVALAGPACCGAEGEKNNGGNSGPSKTESASPEAAIFKSYEKLTEALVEDDLAEVQKSARALQERAEAKDQERTAKLAGKLTAAEDLEAAREALIPLSREVIMLAAGEEGFFVMHCPMVENGKWLQASDAVRNPYMGQRMIACGGVEMKTADLELAPCCEERRACCDDGSACCPVG